LFFVFLVAATHRYDVPAQFHYLTHPAPPFKI
jgi:hypothetical protein